MNLPAFNSFSNDELTQLASFMNYTRLKKGGYLFREGDKGDYMGFVVNGILEVQKKADNGKDITIARLTRGSTIGEMSLVDQSPRSASVLGCQDSIIVTITEKGFDLLSEKHPDLSIKFMKKIARFMSLNMRRTSSRLADLM